MVTGMSGVFDSDHGKLSVLRFLATSAFLASEFTPADET